MKEYTREDKFNSILEGEKYDNKKYVDTDFTRY